ncbi:MAG: ABC transporter ATP-binding protein [Nitrospirota bacterium]|jgi:putative ABC transport system ATP-binding protein
MIELKDVRKVYVLPKIQVEVLRGISLTVGKGEFVAVMGPSGSGKSTLLHLLGCLDRPTSGEYLLEGAEVAGKSDNELAALRNKKIGFVFQSFNLLPRLPAWKNVELPLLYMGVPAVERKDRAMRMLERVGLAPRSNHKPSELSGGEQQRVAIARALINNPAIILADEPTGNLDTRSGQEIMDLVAGLHAEGATIIMVTHEADIGRRAGRIISMRDGLCYDGCF